jgi:hypothetical protein
VLTHAVPEEGAALHVRGGRPSAVVVAILSTMLIVTMAGPAVLAATPPTGLSKFMYAVGQVESGGDYYARNPVSGAYGKYQIMPANWPSWAKAYLGDASAKQTPANQEKVAAGKFTSLHRSLERWRRVAYWWLTGSKQTTGWSAYATRYVERVMALYHKGPPATIAASTTKRYGERHKAIAYTGSWRSAGHAGYVGDRVRYATAKGASATLEFTGRKVVWYGPTGPTRGKARVFIDGKHVKTVDLYERSFDPRAALFKKSWKSSGIHTIRIEVVGTAGRPMVAIDEFVVTR